MEKEELYRIRGFWLSKLQVELYNELLDYMESENMSQTDLAKRLGVSKAYVSQLFNGNFDHKLSKLVDLALVMDKAPILNYFKINNYIKQEDNGMLFPFKVYDYYVKPNPIDVALDGNWHPGFKLRFNYNQDSKVTLNSDVVVSVNASGMLKINNIGYGK